MSVRKESDSLGDVSVPSEAYYGAFTQRALENFQVSSYTTHSSMVRALGLLKLAAAQANMELGLLDKKRGEAIVKASEEVIEGKFNNEFSMDVFQAGAGTPLNMCANEVIANRATEILGGKKGEYWVHPNNHVNMGQSSNNVIPSAIKIAAYALSENVTAQMEALEEALEKKAKEFNKILKTGRTHLQDAVPVTLGQEFEAYAAFVRRDANKVRIAANTLLELGLGGTAIGTGITAHPKFGKAAVKNVVEVTGVKFFETNEHIYLTQSVMPFVDLSGAMRMSAIDLLKVSNDLVFMSSGPRAGISEIQLPEVEPGSSIMPGKVNPSIVEALKMACVKVVGNDTAIEMAAKEGQMELNVMTPVIAHCLIESLEVFANAVKMFTEKCVKGITADDQRARELLEQSTAMATALNPYLGYEVMSRIVKTCISENRSVKDVILENQLMSKADLDKVLDIESLTKPGEVDAGLAEKVKKSKAYEKFTAK
ncbi:MAG TPA: aspartate ammonia-lyase [archaeon]|nr:aspartate ammonia-lyase [archaeon]